MQQKAVTRRVEAKKLLLRRRQSEYSNIGVQPMSGAGGIYPKVLAIKRPDTCLYLW